jgi:hypothetical protein
MRGDRDWFEAGSGHEFVNLAIEEQPDLLEARPYGPLEATQPGSER